MTRPHREHEWVEYIEKERLDGFVSAWVGDINIGGWEQKGAYVLDLELKLLKAGEHNSTNVLQFTLLSTHAPVVAPI
jgi:hypothetical protein